MVQLKGKPVKNQAPPKIRQEETEVWLIPQTGEIFSDYEGYMTRRDFYLQKQFTCSTTNRSGLTFFQALHSEQYGSLEADNPLPEQLREPVLRHVQFSNVPRLGELIDIVYNKFKENFYPGESVITTTSKGDKRHGIIREKITFPEMRGPDGNIQRTLIDRYFVKLTGVAAAGDIQESLVDNQHLTRDRSLFSKQVLRSFLKESISREPVAGAVWVVKKELAEAYKLPTELAPPPQPHGLPMHGRMGGPVFMNNDPKAAQGTFFNFLANQQRPLGIKPDPNFGKLIFNPAPGQQPRPQFQQPLLPAGQAQFAAHPNNAQAPYPQVQPYPQFRHHNIPPSQHKPPPVKYPCEDLEVHPKRNGLQRPELKRLSHTAPDEEDESDEVEQLDQKTVGPLLEIWNTLNVHAEVFLLDSFTFDDFVDAMCYSSDDYSCELLEEVHCAVLKHLVSDDGRVLVQLPEIEEDDDEEDESENEDSTLSTPAREPSPPMRTTRSSLRKSEADALLAQRSPSPPKQVHRAAEMNAEYDWVQRLKMRDFQNGGWEAILVGILRQLSMNPKQKDRCDTILQELAPMDMDPTAETAHFQYLVLDVHHRVEMLQMIAMLAITTKAVRDFLEEMSETMTDLRKKKIAFQRDRKAFLEQYRELDDQRKALAPQNTTEAEPTTNGNGTGNGNGDISMGDATELDETEKSSEEEEDEAPVRVGRSLRSGNARENERKRKREEELARKEKEAKENEKNSKVSTQFQKLLKEIDKVKDKIKDCEEQISEVDNDLREANCQRTKSLGRDRFCNRYYWFERNGMPYGGLPDSSTAEYGYANARIWVQGPDELEREGFIDLSPDLQEKYKQFMGVTVHERRQLEEGPTNLTDAEDWGYIDNPDDLDKLIGWLDERGVREKALRKEIQIWREPIVECMAKFKEFQEKNDSNKAKLTEVKENRMSTRHTTSAISLDDELDKHPCLAWKNTFAVDQLGHRHYEQPKPKPKKVSKKVAFEKAKASAQSKNKKSSGRTGSKLRD